jgi:hypothetical protein
MQKLYEARDSLEAQLLKDRLQTRHIRAVVLGDGLLGGAGELPAMVFPTVWVVESRDLVPAKRVLAEFLHAPPSGDAGTAWVCPGCGERVDAEFDLCWQCGTARPE